MEEHGQIEEPAQVEQERAKLEHPQSIICEVNQDSPALNTMKNNTKKFSPLAHLGNNQMLHVNCAG